MNVLGVIMVRKTGSRLRIWYLVGLTLVLGIGFRAGSVEANVSPTAQFKHLSIPILGMTINQDQRPVGIVTSVIVHFKERSDQEGLRIRFDKMPGKFSPLAQHAVTLAIERVAAAANLETLSWSVGLTFPYTGLTMYGESLSAMVGLSVVALAKGDQPISGRSITGTITEDGYIGKVGGVPQKIYAAYDQHLNRILIPEEHDVRDEDWQMPFLMHVSPVSTVDNAYLGLTGNRLSPLSNRPS
jgi:Lon protease (S16) C-terminal proteolytic domain